jgi:Formamidopyrimidine-DNA glycosylase N-terminal domain
VPELPEVETIRRDIDKAFVNKKIRKVDVSGTRSVRRHGTAKGARSSPRDDAESICCLSWTAATYWLPTWA